jgi:4Fe-4S ferredoxin
MDMKPENCKDQPGRLMPVVDFNKCEAKGPCIMECPHDVFDLKAIGREEYNNLNFVGKLKTRFNGREKAYVVKPGQCHACGLCVTACPEKAIKLIRVA